jgi:hypothetical protein
LDGAIQKVDKEKRLWNFISIEKVLKFINDGGKIMTVEEWENISQMDVYDAKEKWEHLQETLEKELNRFDFGDFNDKLHEIRDFAKQKLTALEDELSAIETIQGTLTFSARDL